MQASQPPRGHPSYARTAALAAVVEWDIGPVQFYQRGPFKDSRDLFHDAVRSYAPPPDADWALPAFEHAPPNGICHGDFAPWNLVWPGEDPVGILDFDLAHPGPASHDVAYALAYSVPFRDDADTKRMLGVDEIPDHRHRIRVFAEAYGIDTDGLVEQVVARQRKYAHDVERLRNRGLVARWTSTDSIARNHQTAGWLDEHRHLFL